MAARAAVLCVLLGVLLDGAGMALAAAPDAHSIVKNQAEATYRSPQGTILPKVRSNTVEALVQQVGGFTLASSQSRPGAPGQILYFPHVLTNTGNGVDDFTLSVADGGPGGFSFASPQLHADANQDGVPDSPQPISATGPLAPGATFRFVAAGIVPVAASRGQQGRMIVAAEGSAGVLVAPRQTNIDTATISNQAVIAASKALDVSSGPSPFDNGGGHVRVTISFTNIGNADATGLRVSDLIGGVGEGFNTTGMVYVPGSALWNNRPLTDAPGGDPAGIDFQAGISGTTAHLSLAVATLPPGSPQTLSFLVDIGAGLPAGDARTRNVARVDYFDGIAAQAGTTNVAAYEVVVPPSAVDLRLTKAAQTATFTTGFQGRYTLVVHNPGNAPTSGTISVTDPLPQGMSFVAQGSGGSGWTCASNGQAAVCSTDEVIAAGGQASPLTLVVAVSDAAAAASQPVFNTATVSGGGEPAANAGSNTASASVTVGLSASLAGRVWLDANHNKIYEAGEQLLDGWQVEVWRELGTDSVRVASTTSGSTGQPGAYRFDGLEAGEGYVVRFVDPNSATLFANPVDGENGTPVSGAQPKDGWLYNITLPPGQTIAEQSLPLDPSGIVYDSQTRLPVIGAKVTFKGPAGFDAARHLLGGLANQTQTTGDSGYYQFLLNDGAPFGVYWLEVEAPAGYLPFSPAGLLPAAPSLNCPSHEHCLNPAGLGNAQNKLEVQAQSGAPASGQPTTYYLRFDLKKGDPDVVNNHIPLDPLPATALSIGKTASRTVVELGDFVDYTIVLRNTTSVAIPGAVTLTDQLPAGFTYQAGSARRDGQLLADPVGAEGRALRFENLPMLGARESYKVSYRVRVGVGAMQGDGINRARAIAGNLSSLTAQAKVEVQPGVFTDKGYIVGKVYLECNRDRVQNAEEVGIPGVRLYLEDGTFAVSDSEGKYSFYGVSPRTHVLKLDMSSMPVGSELVVLGNRNAGDPGSRFVDLKNGELHKANFAEGSCAPEVLRQVEARRQKAGVFVAETDKQLEAQIAAGSRMATAVGDVKALPATGLVGGDKQVPSFEPLSARMPPPLAAADAKSVEPPVRAVPEEDLDALMRRSDNTLDFLALKDGDTLAYAQTTVRVKGRAGMTLALRVNGEELAASRVGRKSVLAERQLEVWEYVGVDLKPGRNALEVLARDPFGNLRGSRAITLVAPDRLGRLTLRLPQERPVADGHTPVRIGLELSDAAGVPVTVRTPVTLEASLGRWDVADLDPREPGVQVFVEGGRAEFALLPPQEPGDAQVRALSGLLKAEEKLGFVPELRPLVAAGVIEGVLNLRSLSGGSLVPARADDGFEQELRHFSRRSADGKSDAGARAAFFLKGKVKGEYLLTMAYDSDKDTRERLFRDIRPDQFYPVYGDSSVKGFDAQSTSRLYVRVDHDKSYLLWGDYTTGSAGQARQLGNYSRSLTGIKEHYESGTVSANAFASYDSSRQVVEELPARGISGPYVIAGRDILGNSEKVELLTRDRNQPGVILKAVALARFTDYDFEPYTGRLLFRSPIPTLDADFNPNSIRVTYEVEQGGEKFWVYGADVQAKVASRVELGGSYVKDQNPLDGTELRSVNATVQLADKTFLIGETARIERDTTGEGDARRVELRHEGERLQARLYAGRSDVAFTNPASPLANGREETGAKVALRLGASTALKAEAIRTEDTANGSGREGVLASVEHSFGRGFKAELGARHSVETSAATAAPATDTQREVDSLRARLTGQVSPRLSLFGEYEQDVKDSDRRIAALGGDYQLGERSRLYGRYEFISTLGSTYALGDSAERRSTVFGIDTDYMRDGHLFSEYRLRDALSGREAEAAVGLRNKWQVAEGLNLNTNFERIQALEGAGNSESLAVGAGVEYTASPLWKGTARVEFREAGTSDQWLLSLGLANKLSRDWTFLGREVYSIMRNDGSTVSRLLAHRLQLGLAYRDTDTDRINALGRIEHKIEKDTTNPLQALEQEAVILSSHLNFQYSKPLLLSGRAAAKWATDRSNGLTSRSRLQALGARLTYDLDWKWDIGVHASVMRGDGGTYHAGLGGELGYQLATNLWVSGGYNWFGYKEPDLSGGDHTARGAYVHLRFKFDEHLFSGKDEKVNVTLPPQASEAAR